MLIYSKLGRYKSVYIYSNSCVYLEYNFYKHVYSIDCSQITYVYITELLIS
jgi:hypothetical protein